jgi:hypothetical protein
MVELLSNPLPRIPHIASAAPSLLAAQTIVVVRFE